MGTLTEIDKNYLAQNFLAFFRRDYRRVAQVHIESGWAPKDTRVDEFEAAIRAVCEPIFAKPLKEISFGRVLLRLFQTSRRFNIQVQPQLVLLQKTLLNIEGLGRELDPELDLWADRQALPRALDVRAGRLARLHRAREAGSAVLEHDPAAAAAAAAPGARAQAQADARARTSRACCARSGAATACSPSSPRCSR